MHLGHALQSFFSPVFEVSPLSYSFLSRGAYALFTSSSLLAGRPDACPLLSVREELVATLLLPHHLVECLLPPYVFFFPRRFSPRFLFSPSRGRAFQVFSGPVGSF